MRLGYVNSNLTYMTVDEQKQVILDYAKKNSRKLDDILVDDELNFSTLQKMSKNIQLVIPNVAVFGNRYEDVLRMVQACVGFGVSLYFVLEEILIDAKHLMSFSQSAEICFKMFKSVLSIKNSGIVANLRKSGRKVGRPSNSVN